jgi:hypothetical protein
VAGDQATGASGKSYNGVQLSSSKPNANRLAELKDAYVDYQVTENKALNVEFGQYKVQYVAPADDRVRPPRVRRNRAPNSTPRSSRPARVPGLSVWGTMGGEKEDIFEWYAGAFNGGHVGARVSRRREYGERRQRSPLQRPHRVESHGGVPYAQTDLRPEEERDAFLFAIGANAWLHDDDNRRADGDTFDQSSFGVDVTATWDGWFFAGEAHWRNSAQRNSTSGTPAVTTSYDDIGTDGWFCPTRLLHHSAEVRRRLPLRHGGLRRHDGVHEHLQGRHHRVVDHGRLVLERARLQVAGGLRSGGRPCGQRFIQR